MNNCLYTAGSDRRGFYSNCPTNSCTAQFMDLAKAKTMVIIAYLEVARS
jgi:hypothetical protein